MRSDKSTAKKLHQTFPDVSAEEFRTRLGNLRSRYPLISGADAVAHLARGERTARAHEYALGWR